MIRTPYPVIDIMPNQLDVTDKVQALLSSPHSLKVGPETLGEPCFGVVKTLRIEMTASTGAHTLVFKEGETVNLPRPGELNTTITKATFVLSRLSAGSDASR